MPLFKTKVAFLKATLVYKKNTKAFSKGKKTLYTQCLKEENNILDTRKNTEFYFDFRIPPLHIIMNKIY